MCGQFRGNVPGGSAIHKGILAIASATGITDQLSSVAYQFVSPVVERMVFPDLPPVAMRSEGIKQALAKGFETLQQEFAQMNSKGKQK